MSDRVVRCTSIKDLERKLGRDMKSLQKRLRRAVSKTAEQAEVIIRRNSPKAFGDLRNSIDVVVPSGLSAGEETKTVVTAPHASAVEVGSRPHLVPLEDLIEWVKLRGMQGLTSKGHARSEFATSARIGTTTAMHARSITSQIRAMQDINGSTPIDAPERIARAIQQTILENGTHPHWYVRGSLPAIVSKLDSNVRLALAGHEAVIAARIARAQDPARRAKRSMAARKAAATRRMRKLSRG